MTPTTPTNGATNAPTQTYSPLTRTVFDLASFDNVKLTKPFNAPAKPATVEEALGLVGNDSQKLLDLIYSGLVSAARDTQYADITGFRAINDDGETASEDYRGQYADDEGGKRINLAILGLAKTFALGSWDSLSKEDKRAKKDLAVSMIRSNPAMLTAMTGVPPATAEPAK